VLCEAKIKQLADLLNWLSSSSLCTSSLSERSTGSIVTSPSASRVLPTWLASSSSSLEGSTVACLEGPQEELVVEALEAKVEGRLRAIPVDFMADFF
jgi:hypothetical protein